MKLTYYICLIVISALTASAGPKEILEHNRNVQSVAADLFRQQKPNEAVSYLAINIRQVSPGRIAPLSTVEALMGVAFNLKGRRHGAAAVSAANQALTLLIALPPTTARDADRANVFSQAGLLCERVLIDAALGKQYYEAALALHPFHQLAKERIQQLERSKNSGRL